MVIAPPWEGQMDKVKTLMGLLGYALGLQEKYCPKYDMECIRDADKVCPALAKERTRIEDELNRVFLEKFGTENRAIDAVVDEHGEQGFDERWREVADIVIRFIYNTNQIVAAVKSTMGHLADDLPETTEKHIDDLMFHSEMYDVFKDWVIYNNGGVRRGLYPKVEKGCIVD